MLPSRPAVAATVTLIAENTDQAPLSIVMKNRTGTESVFLGGAAVTTATGYEWQTTDGPLSVDLLYREKLWGIVATNAQTLHVLKGGSA